MYARTTIVQADPARLDDGVAVVRQEVFPAVTAMEGCAGMSMLVNRDSGRCIATTAWDSEAALQASAEAVRPLRDRAIEALGASSSEVHAWEVAVVHRDHVAPDGACARVTWLSGDPDLADRAADMFRMVVLPRVRELDGFCSASMFVDRDSGRAVGTVTFASRAALEASRDAAKRIRETASQQAGARVDAVEEMEVAFAHLHVPEMA